MCQASVLRALSVDRSEPPGKLLGHFDTVLSRLLPGRTGTCVCARLSQHDGQWQALLGSAGHLPPPADDKRCVRRSTWPCRKLLLGTGIDNQQPWPTRVPSPFGSTLLLCTDGLMERRDRHLDDGLAELKATVDTLAAAPVEELTDELLTRLAPHPTDDVCLLAVHVPKPLDAA